ncbi:MAG: dockerin type I domain-containing protein, partial [Pirellulales bacterium]
MLSADASDTWRVAAPGDFDADRVIGLRDLAILQSNLGTLSGATAFDGDLNGNGVVNRTDMALFSQLFGRSYVAGAPSPALSPAPPALPTANAGRADVSDQLFDRGLDLPLARRLLRRGKLTNGILHAQAIRVRVRPPEAALTDAAIEERYGVVLDSHAPSSTRLTARRVTLMPPPSSSPRVRRMQ